MSDTPSAPPPGDEFDELVRKARQVTAEADRAALVQQAREWALQEHYDAEPAPSCPNPVADLRRDCIYHRRLLDLLGVDPQLMPWGNIAGPIRRYWQRMRDLYQSQKVSKKPPLEPGIIDTGRLGGIPLKLDGARQALRTILDWCEDAAAVPQKAGKGKNINARMLEMLQGDSSCVNWTARQFAHQLGCSVSTVQGTTAWENILTTRKLQEADAANRRREEHRTDRRRFGKTKRSDGT